jgi:hypothetical protein
LEKTRDIKAAELLSNSSFSRLPQLRFFLRILELIKTFNPLVPCGHLGLEGFGLRPILSPLVYPEINSLCSLNSHYLVFVF